jgi:hypothetical protein
MKNRPGYIRTKLATLIFLVLLVVHFGTQANTVSACQQCVFPTGGICVGCMVDAESGFVSCDPDQSTCRCSVGGGSCPAPGGGGMDPNGE